MLEQYLFFFLTSGNEQTENKTKPFGAPLEKGKELKIWGLTGDSSCQ